VNVRVRGHGQLARFTNGAELELEVGGAPTVREVVARLGIPAGVSFLVLVNERQGNLSDALTEGDSVLFLPGMAGGI
jgi:molybdopterin converting factor small subunit